MNTKYKKALAVVFALATFSVISASAATLGGLSSTALGADQRVIASCDTDGINLAYTNVFNATTNAYQTTAVTMSGVNSACTGQSFQLSLSDATTSLGETSGSVALTAGTQIVTLVAPINAGLITRASLVITG